MGLILKNWKWLLMGLGAIFIFASVKKFSKGVLSAFGIEEPESNQPPPSVEVKKTKLNKDSTFYPAFANELEEWMKSLGNSPNWHHHEKLEKMNEDELKHLWNEFGIRTNDQYGSWFSWKGNLGTWFDNEYGTLLDTYYYNKLKEIFKPTELWP